MEIEIVMPNEEQSLRKDVMDGALYWETKIGEHGKVALVDVMPRTCPIDKTADFCIVQAARVSYGDGTKHINEDRGLIRYLMRHSHTTPFEMAELKFRCVMPVFVARQWIRHRTANVNEYSARYSIVKDTFYKPNSKEDVREQSSTNRQGSDGKVDNETAQEFIDFLDFQSQTMYDAYKQFLEQGISREQARIILPLSVYTEWYWKIDLHNLFHFLKLRMDSHAQKEIRDYANAMFQMVKKIFPISCEAFEDYRLNSINLSRLEIEALRKIVNNNLNPNIDKEEWLLESSNKREADEWADKLKLLFV